MWQNACDRACIVFSSCETAPIDLDRGLSMIGALNVVDLSLLALCSSLDRGLTLFFAFGGDDTDNILFAITR